MNDDIQSNLTLRYMLAGIGLSSVTIMAIVAVTIFRPEHDNTAIIAQILVVSGGTLPGLAAFIRSQANAEEARRIKREQDEKAEAVRRALEEANRKIEAANTEQKKHLERQDEKLETVVKQTNGLIDEIKDKARKEGHESGEKAALKQLGIEPKRLGDRE